MGPAGHPPLRPSGGKRIIFCPRFFSGSGCGVSPWVGSGQLPAARRQQVPTVSLPGARFCALGKQRQLHSLRGKSGPALVSRTQGDPLGPGVPPAVPLSAHSSWHPAPLRSHSSPQPVRASPLKGEPLSHPLDGGFSACKYILATSSFLPLNFPMCLFKKLLPREKKKKSFSVLKGKAANCSEQGDI